MPEPEPGNASPAPLRLLLTPALDGTFSADCDRSWRVAAGDSVVLTGAGSVGADGRTITAYAWTLVSGATSLSALAGRETSFVAPGADVVVRLTVTDDQGRSDSTDATVRVGSVIPPPTPPSALPVPTPVPIGSSRSGGGGPFDPLALTLAAALASRARRRRLGTAPRA
jgi:hypothetical protein